jgi:hypothetical protein
MRTLAAFERSTIVEYVLAPAAQIPASQAKFLLFTMDVQLPILFLF